MCIQQQPKYNHTELTFMVNMENITDWLASNKTLKKWTGIGDGELLSYAGNDYGNQQMKNN
jgi:hypothetical protein